MSIEQKTTRKNSRHFAPVGIIFGLLGLILFVYFVRRVGLAEVVTGIRRLGAGFLLVLAISSVRYVVRSLAWVNCIETPYRLRFRDAFVARVIGDALGNLIPLASVAISEPSKAVFVKQRLPLVIGFSSLAIENIFYSISVAVFIFAGTVTLLLNFSVPRALRYAAIGTLVVTVIVILVVLFLLRRQWRFISGALRLIGTHRAGRKWSLKALPRAETLEDRIYGFYQRNQKSFLTILLLEVMFHSAGVAEIYTTLSFVSPVHPTLLTAFILESVNRIINVAFKFVPLRTGVDEAGTGMLAKVIGFTTATGVTLAIVRKGRDIVWASIGVMLLLKKGFSIREGIATPQQQLEELSDQPMVGK
jgi:hypothetical protein